ncbi:glycosyl transferase group 1 [Serratia symbiotica str. 'Cinara cedri']|nr:glycosyl transferase group 1 [Serratia symbiotica str. 'Cinara cedri']
MRILMIIDGLSGGGAEKTVLNLCHGMHQMGHNVSLISLREICTYPIPHGINYHIVTDHNQMPWRKLTEISRRTAALDQAIANIEQKNGAFDLAFSNLHKTDRIVSRSKLLTSDRLWFCIHGILSVSYLSHRKAVDRWLKQRKISTIYQKQNIVAVSRAVSNDLQQNLLIRPQSLVVINNPFDIATIKQLSMESCELAGQEYLVHVGRFHPHKQHDLLLKAYAHSGVQVPLVLIGTGKKTSITETRRLAAQLGIMARVKILGFQTNPYKFIRHASLLVLSSSNEGFGNVLIEALLCNTPVVSTRCPGGAVEILEKANMSHALAELNESSLAAKIAQIYANPPKINHQQLLEYSLNTICRQYLALKK